jgi:hypothetical protein
LVGDEDFRSQGKLILDLGGLLMEAATVKERILAFFSTG